MQKYRKLAGAVLAVTVGITSTTLVAAPAEAARPARIKGIVTTPDGTALPGIRVSALAEMAIGGVDQWVEVDTAVTGLDGRYSVGKLDDGTYRVRFDDPSGAYATEFYNDQVRAEDAEDVLLLPGGGMRELLPAELGSAGHLTGSVTGSSGSGIEGAQVTAYVEQDGQWIPFTSVSSGPDGRYDVGGLPGGVYTLGFHDPASSVTEYWNDRAVLAEADTLTIDNSGSTTGLDAQLATPLPPEPAPEPKPTPAPTPSPAPAPAPAPAAAPTVTAAPVAAAVTVVRKPRIRGLVKATQQLRVTRGTWNPTKVTRKIQWLANGKKIKRATKNRLRLTAKLVGKRISVRVVAAAPGRTPITVTTRRTKKVAG